MGGFGEVLHRWASECPQDEAFTFLGTREARETRWSYGELDRRARRVATALSRFDGLVLLVQPTGPEFVEALFGCFYAGRLAIPTYPPHPMSPRPALQRFRGVVANARPAVIAVSAQLATVLDQLRDEIPEVAGIPRVITDGLPDTEALSHEQAVGPWSFSHIDNEQLAVLQYTSGSSGEPRGVMLTHANLLANARFMADGIEHTRESRAVTWLPPYHDMGLMGGLLQPVFGGVPCTFFPTLDFMMRPIRWLRAISSMKGTISGGPNFAYELCVNRITDEEVRDVDLRSWVVAYNGAEPVNPTVLQRFYQRFRANGFRIEAFCPSYGLAESTLAVTLDRVGRPPLTERFDRLALSEGRLVKADAPGPSAVVVVGCGRPASEGDCLIVDQESREPAAPGTVGEIWLRGASIARGYWNDGERTDAAFGAKLATGEGPFLRTGDLGAMIDGELFVTGRLKDVIIIRGRNHAPQDIEAAVASSHPMLRPSCGAAFAVHARGEEHLVVVHEVESSEELDAAAVMRKVRRSVADATDLQPAAVVLIRRTRLPKTTSGKVRRRECRRLFLDGGLDVVAEWRSPALQEHDERGTDTAWRPGTDTALEATDP